MVLPRDSAAAVAAGLPARFPRWQAAAAGPAWALPRRAVAGAVKARLPVEHRLPGEVERRQRRPLAEGRHRRPGVMRELRRRVLRRWTAQRRHRPPGISIGGGSARLHFLDVRARRRCRVGLGVRARRPRHAARAEPRQRRQRRLVLLLFGLRALLAALLLRAAFLCSPRLGCPLRLFGFGHRLGSFDLGLGGFLRLYGPFSIGLDGDNGDTQSFSVRRPAHLVVGDGEALARGRGVGLAGRLLTDGERALQQRLGFGVLVFRLV